MAAVRSVNDEGFPVSRYVRSRRSGICRCPENDPDTDLMAVVRESLPGRERREHHLFPERWGVAR